MTTPRPAMRVGINGTHLWTDEPPPAPPTTAEAAG
jgi:hypothetical protein